MTTNQKIQFIEPQDIIMRLDAALETEREKYRQFPIPPDMAPYYREARAWGYVIAGYFLLEESFKALLHLRNIEVPRKHSLTMLFDLFEPDDKDILREYYSDYCATIDGHVASLPFATLDEFLENLDGDPNQRGSDYVGSFDWRYLLIEETKSQNMPFISIHYLHEVARGSINIIKYIHRGNKAINSRKDTHSWSIYWQNREKCGRWLNVRVNSDGWGELPDRLELLSGPDNRKRYDWLLFIGNNAQSFFSELPPNTTLPIFDKRQEFEEYDWQ